MKTVVYLLLLLLAAPAMAQTGANFSNPNPGFFTNVNDSALTASSPVCTDSSKNLSSTCPAGDLPILIGTTGSIGGSALLVGTCATGTATVTGVTGAMVIVATPVTNPGAGFDWQRSYVSGTNTVTVQVCADVAGTPTASTYNVRVIQ